MDPILGIDIGGTGIKAALVDVNTGTLLTERVKVATPPRFTLESVLEALAELSSLLPDTTAAGVCFPSVVSGGVVRSAPTAHRHQGWLGVDLVEEFSDILGMPTRALNDADAAAVAEMGFGAGQGENGTVMVCTLGTGIGSGLFSKGKLVPNIEIGRVYLPNEEFSGEHQAAERSRKEESLSWEVWGGRVNDFLHQIQDIFAPDLLVIGGGVSRKHQKFLKYIDVSCRVVPAHLRNNAGIVGAAVYGAK